MYKYIILILLCTPLAALLPFASPINAQSPDPISLEQYRTILTEAISMLDAPVEPSTAIDNVDALLNSVQEIQLPSGDLISPRAFTHISTNDVAANDITAQADALRQKITLLIDQIDHSASDNSAERLDALQDIFNRSQFSQSETLWQRFVNWLGDLFDRWFPDLGSGEGASTLGVSGEAIAWIVLLVGGVAIAFLLSYWLQGIFGNFVRDESAERSDHDGDGVPLTARAARQQATQLAQAGDYRDAVRSLYLSALLSMEESGVVRHDRSMTNREVLRQLNQRDLPNREDVQDHLRPVVDTFDDVWYGVREPDANTFQEYEREIDGLDSAVRSATGPTTARSTTTRSTTAPTEQKARRR